MNKYVVLYETTVGLLDDYRLIEGKTGVDALNNSLPDRMVGIVKRSRQSEINEHRIDFILQRYIEENGYKTARGPRISYTYHPPKIVKEPTQ